MPKSRRLNGYILVYNPDSKYAMKSDNWEGYVYEHIAVIEERVGTIPDGFEVHHLDGNKENNRDDNLILLSKADHTRLHNWLSCVTIEKSVDENRMNSGEPKRFRCIECNKPLGGSNSKFCSVVCKNMHMSKKPKAEELAGKTIDYISSKYKVTKKTARKWFHSYGI